MVLDRWGMLAVVGVSLILSMTTWFSATAIAPDLTSIFHLTAAGASWLTGAVQLGFVAAALALGVSGLIDTWPSRGLIAGASLLAGVANLAILAVPDATSLFAARFVTGAALAGVYPPALKLIATWFVTARGLAMGAAIGALTLGSSTPYFVKAVGGTLDWRLVVITASAAAALGAGLVVLFVREGPHGVPRPKPEIGRVVEVIRDPALSLANLGYFGHMWELYAMWGWFLAYVEKAGAAHIHGLGAPALTFCVIAIGALGCLAGGVLGDGIGRTATAGSMMVVSGACALAIGAAFAGPTWLFLTIAAVWGFSIIADSAQFSAMVTELSDARTTGAALALQVGVGFALTIVSIRLVPLVAAYTGWRWVFIMLAPGPLIGAAAMFGLRRMPRSRSIANGRR